VRRRWTVLAVAVIAPGTCSVAWRSTREAHSAPTSAVAARDVPFVEGTLIRYSARFAERAGIAIAIAEEADLSPLVTVTGSVTFDPELTAAVGARIAGRVRAIRRFEGAEVRAGDVLAEIESAELGQAQAALTSARARADEATSNENRERQLAQARVSSDREAEQAHAAAASARAQLFAADQQVRALGGAPNGQLGILVLRSPIGGKVVEVHVSSGQSVEPSLTAFRVADLSRLWIELAVFERDLASIHPGDPVEISPQTDTATVIMGEIAHVGDVIDLDTRSADVRVVVQNKDESLRPGQSVIAHIARAPSAGAATSKLVVPRNAVVSVDGRSTVFVSRDATSAEPRAVVLGARDASRVEVTSGIQPGDRIVVEGVFALKSELFR
jgi:cobalt-zinc-cadmium efflux system membrane fusion protein